MASGNSAELLRNSLPRFRLGHITANKREIKDFRKIACWHLVARRYTPLRKYASYLYALIYLKAKR